MTDRETGDATADDEDSCISILHAQGACTLAEDKFSGLLREVDLGSRGGEGRHINLSEVNRRLLRS